MGQGDRHISHPTSPSVFILSLSYVLSCSATPKLAKSNSIAVNSSEDVASFFPSYPQRDWLEMTGGAKYQHLPVGCILHNKHTHTHTPTHREQGV